MAEVPEHLLRRSRERRAALGLDKPSESGAPGTEAAPAPAEAGAPAGEASAPAGEAGAPAPAASAPAPATPARTPAPAAEQVPARPGGGVMTEAPPGPSVPVPSRARIPIWAIPVLVALPVWSLVYVGAFGSRTKAAVNDPVALGAGLFAGNCAVCHGANGEGGVGPQLAGGAVLKTWPNVADHISWVHTGGAPFVGKTYGGQGHAVPANNVMPAFGQDHGGSLTDAQIVDIVCYERIGLSGASRDPSNCPALGAAPGS